MTAAKIELDAKQLAGVIGAMLARSFLEAPRAEAKRLFRAVRDDASVPFITLELKHSGSFCCRLTLDAHGYVGSLSFSAFRRALAHHVHRLSEAIEREASLNLFSNEEGSEIVFHHPGVIETDGQINVLVSGTRQLKPDELLVTLRFLDPQALERAPERRPRAPSRS